LKKRQPPPSDTEIINTIAGTKSDTPEQAAERESKARYLLKQMGKTRRDFARMTKRM
jgi:hypothetical protein